MGMNRNITLVRGIKVEYSALDGKDLDDFEFPDGVYWYCNGECSYFVYICDIQRSIDVEDKAFPIAVHFGQSTENDEKILNFCLNVLRLFCDSSDIKNWAVADFS